LYRDTAVNSFEITAHSILGNWQKLARISERQLQQAKYPPGPPMDLGNMREFGARLE
jgi:hypothetical protein